MRRVRAVRASALVLESDLGVEPRPVDDNDDGLLPGLEADPAESKGIAE